ncbi:MAG: proton-conducting transporter membrane subunit, partial [Nitrospirae bacterium]|nr:proton-conducting transporter membrane subunit [Nitrospirota bacterium]
LMTDLMTTPLLLAAVPIMGAMLGLVVWSQPDKLKIWSVIVTVLSLLAVIGISGQLTESIEGPLFLYLLPLAAGISLLGGPVHQQHRLACVLTLLFLGLGLGILTSQQVAGQIVLAILLGLITFLLYWHHIPFWPRSWWGIGAYGVGALCAGLAAVTGPPVSAQASLLACAILLPLVPFHHGYVSALTRLPGSLPSFIVLLLPAIGFHSLVAVIPMVPEIAVSMMTILALVGALYGSIKALAQSRVRLLLAYGSLSFFSILWWCVAVSRTIMPQAVVFLASVALVTSGLLLTWQVVRTRYGDDVDPQAISGLFRRMPQFAVLFSLLALAGMGLPPFGVFAGFMGMLLTASLTSSAALLVMMVAWLAASWYILDMVQRLLFGRERSDLRYEDLRRSELASLLIVVLIVIALGVAPASLFGIKQQPPSVGAVQESVSWNR